MRAGRRCIDGIRSERACIEPARRRRSCRAQAHAHAIARESGGNPFFVTELVRHISVGAVLSVGSAASEVNLDEVLWDRIRRLPGGARRFLEVVAVSGQPVRQASVCRVADLGGEGPASLAVLRTGHLVRGAGSGSLDDVEVYHDRIRETVVKHLSPEVLKTWHGELAQVLEDAKEADSETLAVHFEAAGKSEMAGKYYAEAAAKAAKALAFDRAAKLYRQALELWPNAGEAGRSLRVGLGDALANAGRGVEAARAYQDAANSARRARQSCSCRVARLISSSSAGTSTKDSRPSINCWRKSACGYRVRRGARC